MTVFQTEKVRSISKLQLSLAYHRCVLVRSDCRFGAQTCRSFVSGDNASTISGFASSHVLLVLWAQFTANEIAHFIVLFTPLK